MFAREKKDKKVGQLLPELRWDFVLRICQGHAQWEEPTLGPTARKGRGCHGGGICHKRLRVPTSGLQENWEVCEPCRLV